MKTINQKPIEMISSFLETQNDEDASKRILIKRYETQFFGTS